MQGETSNVVAVVASAVASAEVSSRYVLHWDCRGALLLPHVERGARHVEELHLRRCGLGDLPPDFQARFCLGLYSVARVLVAVAYRVRHQLTVY